MLTAGSDFARIRLTVEWIDMCGRYNLISNLTVFGERFQFDATQLTLEAAYNVAPTQDVLTVIGGESRRRRPGGFWS